MARVQKSFKVARMNAILKDCRVKHRPGLKMADKAALIVEAVPRDRFGEFLDRSGTDAPATKKARTETMTPMSGGANPLTNYFGGAFATAPGAGGQSETPKAESTYASLGELYQEHVLGAPRAACSTARSARERTRNWCTESGASIRTAKSHRCSSPVRRASIAAVPTWKRALPSLVADLGLVPDTYRQICSHFFICSSTCQMHTCRQAGMRACMPA